MSSSRSPAQTLLIAQRLRRGDAARLPRGEDRSEQRGQQRNTDDDEDLLPGHAEEEARLILLEEVSGEDVAGQNQAERDAKYAAEHADEERFEQEGTLHHAPRAAQRAQHADL